MPAAPHGLTAVLHLTLLGRMMAHDGTGRQLLPPGRKARAVLAILALAAPDPVPRARLLTLLWSTRSREQAQASLRQCVHELQDSLATLGRPVLRATRSDLALDATALSVDLGRALPPRSSPMRLLDDLSGLDPAFDAFLEAQRSRLNRHRAASAATILEGTAEPASVIAAAEQALAVDPTQEAVWRRLIQARLLRGERAAALEAFERSLIALPPGPNPALLALLAEPAVPPPLAIARSTARLGVMPLRAQRADDADLSIGLAEEITTALSRFRWITLVASTSLATLSGTPDTNAAWQQLDLDFLLDGSVQRHGSQVRITVRLLDLRAEATGGAQIAWAGRFDRTTDDLLTLQDDIAGQAAARIDPELLLRVGRRATVTPPANATAYDLVLRAIPAIYRLEEQGFRLAGDALARAVALDPDHAGARTWLACWLVFQVGQGWAPHAGDAMAEAGRQAQRAVALDPSDARALTIAGHVAAFLHHRFDAGLELHTRALALNPNLPLAWAFSGLAHAYAGQQDEAIRRTRHAQTLSPFDPHSFFFEMALIMPHLLRHDFTAAAAHGRRAMALNPGFSSTLKGLLSALGHLGAAEEAAEARARLLVLEPGFTLAQAAERSPLRGADAVIYLDGLRLAGLG